MRLGCHHYLVEDKIQNTFQGHVKWYNMAKGFGFIVTDDPGPDILVHANILRNFGCETLGEGSAIEVVAQEGERGLQAVEILSVEEQEPIDDSENFQRSVPQKYDGSPDGVWMPARVKWFDKMRGFGFANAFGSKDDIFIHMEILRQCNLSELQQGEAIAIRIREGPRGKSVADICSWEMATINHAQGVMTETDLPEIDSAE